MPRSYRLGERAVLVEATRERIVDAAIELYLEVGISAATMREIGARADVAPGTLRSHFRTRDDLDRAIVARMTAGVRLPDRSMFDGTSSIEERLSRIIRAGGTFIEEARHIYRMWLREPMLTAPWTQKGAEFGARWDELMRTALGPLADDEDAMAVLRSVIHPGFFDNLRGGTRSIEDASTLAAAVVVPWFSTRARERAEGPQADAGASGRPDPR